jgi:hypothetical protein
MDRGLLQKCSADTSLRTRCRLNNKMDRMRLIGDDKMHEFLKEVLKGNRLTGIEMSY